MKLSLTLSLLSLVALSIAIPSNSFEQVPLSVQDGFDLDLNAPRLIQLEGQAPEWVTESRKVWFHSETIVRHS